MIRIASNHKTVTNLDIFNKSKLFENSKPYFLIDIVFVDFVFEKNQLYFLLDLLRFYFPSNLRQKKLL